MFYPCNSVANLQHDLPVIVWDLREPSTLYMYPVYVSDHKNVTSLIWCRLSTGFCALFHAVFVFSSVIMSWTPMYVSQLVQEISHAYFTRWPLYFNRRWPQWPLVSRDHLGSETVLYDNQVGGSCESDTYALPDVAGL